MAVCVLAGDRIKRAVDQADALLHVLEHADPARFIRATVADVMQQLVEDEIALLLDRKSVV